MNLTKFMEKAKDISKLSTYPKQNLGCVMVYKNRVIGVGWNCDKEHPLQKHYNKLRGFNVDECRNTVHAEISAILNTRDMDIDWSKVSMFIYRETKDGNMALAKPCEACSKAIEDLGIQDVYYSSRDGIYKL